MFIFAAAVFRAPGWPRGRVVALVAQLVEHGSNKPRVGGSSPSWSIYRSYSVMVITKDSDSFNPGSSPGRTFLFCKTEAGSKIPTEKKPPCADFRALSSAVERRIADPEVTGSIPVVPLFCFLLRAGSVLDAKGVRRERVAFTGHWSSGMILL